MCRTSINHADNSLKHVNNMQYGVLGHVESIPGAIFNVGRILCMFVV